MCGIAGILDPDASTSADRLGALAATMASSLEHRGPDADGVWVDADAGVAFGHRRLAVIDLGPGGAQPMASPGGRWVIAYNGEVYNHPELRLRLERAGNPVPRWIRHGGVGCVRGVLGNRPGARCLRGDVRRSPVGQEGPRAPPGAGPLR